MTSEIINKFSSALATEIKIDDCWNRIGVRGDHSCAQLVQQVHCRNCPVYSAAARDIMQRPMPDNYQQDWAKQLATTEQSGKKHDLSLMVFRVKREWLALPSSVFQSIAEMASAHHLPHRSGAVLLGVANVRGKLYPCMSLAGLLQLDAIDGVTTQTRRIYPRLMLVNFSGQTFALPVDDMLGVHRLHSDALRAAPTSVNKATAHFMTGVLSIDELRVGCLDAELLGYQLKQVLR